MKKKSVFQPACYCCDYVGFKKIEEVMKEMNDEIILEKTEDNKQTRKKAC